VIGLDPVREQLADVSRRAGRRVERGGVPNLLFALATAQRPPEELDGRAGEVLVTLPWGDLLEGLALAHADVLDGLATLARPGARLRLVLNGAAWAANAPTRMRRLPRLTPEYVRLVLAERYAAHGILVDDARRLRDDEIDALHSTWAKRLCHGNGRPELTLIEAHV
jgi:16S rRNA (adenine(1408)-N(1))-methyltransferase